MKQLLETLKPHVEEGARIMLIMFLAVAMAITLAHVSMALFHQYPLDYGEAPLVDQAMRLAAGENTYRADISVPPYTISNYPPLYPLSITPFVKLFGPSFWAGRVISVLCALASAMFLSRIIYAGTQDRMAAAVTALLFLSFPYVVGWSKLLRVDMLALALSTAGLYVARRWPSTWRGLVVSALLLVGAIYTRQSYGLAAPAAAFFWLWTQDRRQALRLAVLVGGMGLILFLALNVLTGGGFFFHIVTANVNEFDIQRLGRHVSELLTTVPILLVMGGVFLFLGPRRTNNWALVVPYLIGAGLSGATIGKIGSNANYLLELCAALSLVAGTFLVWSRERPWVRSALLVFLALQTGLMIRATLNGPIEGLKWQLLPAKDLNSYDFRYLERLVETADRPVLADEFMGFLTLQNKPLYLQPFEITQLANAGLWDQTPLLKAIRQQEFPAILIHHFRGYPVYQERWTPEMLSAITESYSATDFWAETLVFRPREEPETGPAGLEACPGAPWRLPTQGELGMWWMSKQLAFMGQGYENSVPVYAVADGLLTRLPHWKDAVAIRHDDPLRPGEKVWTFYGGMASGESDESFVLGSFPPGSEGTPVQKGQLLGYQGQWFGGPGMPTWVHLRFAVLPSTKGVFPVHIVEHGAEEKMGPYKEESGGPLDPSPYLGTVGSNVMGTPTWMPLRCQPSE